MTMLFCDSFDHYATGQMAQKYNSVSVALSQPSISSSNARNGSQCLQAGNAGGSACWVTVAIANRATIFVGFAFQPVANQNTNSYCILALNDGATSQLLFYLNPNMTISCYRQNTGNLLGTSASAFKTGLYTYFEVKATIDPSAGVVQVRFNGQTDAQLNLTGQNTRASANSQVNGVLIGQVLGSANTANTLYFDDFYICDTNGSFNNNFLGDITVQAVLPNANGTTNNWTKGGSTINANNYQQVNENPPDGDTTYVIDNNIGDIDRYLYPAIVPTAGTVDAVVVWPYARKDDAGLRSIRAATKSGSTLGDNGSDLALNQQYAYFMGLFESDPNTSAAWTLANAEAAEFGVKLTV